MTASASSSAEAAALPAGIAARGRIALPPSKSLTHRACAVALLADGPVVVENPLLAEDTELFLTALDRLGCTVERFPGRVVLTPPTRWPRRVEIECGNAGTLLRFLVALAATLPTSTRLDGTPRLRERPLAPMVGALRGLGVRVEHLEREGFAPLRVDGGRLDGGRVRLDAGESSQYLSALLLAAQRAASPLEIEVEALVSAPYVQLTVEVLRHFGGWVERPAPGFWRAGPAPVHGGTIAIEPDLSAAAYPAAAAALTGGDVLLERVRLASSQGDRRFLDLVREMGAEVMEEDGGVRVRGGGLRALEVDAADIPDQVPTLAALAPFARGRTRILNVRHLRLKESDRLAAMASELRRAGAEVREREDGLEVTGTWAERPAPSNPVSVEPHGDHRIAMAMALVGLRRPNLSVDDPRVVAKSWPEFWSAMAGLLRSPEQGGRGS